MGQAVCQVLRVLTCGTDAPLLRWGPDSHTDRCCDHWEAVTVGVPPRQRAEGASLVTEVRVALADEGGSVGRHVANRA